jgi:signal transduction histidine kinase
MKRLMKRPEALFSSNLWMRALESYGSSAHLTVKLFDAEARVVLGPVHPTPLFQLFEEKKYVSGLFAECVRLCLAQTGDRPVLILSQSSGVSVIGTSLELEGEIVGAAVGGFALLDFSQASEIQILARDSGIRFEQLWQVARAQKPEPRRRLTLMGELLQVLGDSLLSENYRTRQYEETAQKLKEVAVAKEQLHEEFRKQQERLHKVEKMAAAGQLASSLAHEINNPLSSVTNALYLLETSAGLDESARAFVTTAVTELDRVSRIVKQSLSYYQVGTTPLDVDLGVIASELLKIFRGKFGRSGIELKWKARTGSQLVGYPDELRQVIHNLLLNALEAMPGGGCLGVSVHESFDWIHNRREGDRRGVRLTISDSGHGIPKPDRAMIFEPFFTTKPEQGNGLGLWILQGIVAKHEGTISVRSSNRKGRSGTAISIFFPSHARALGKLGAPRLESFA